MNFIKPKQLKRGDIVAIVSPSWGGPAAFPHIYESGLRVLENLGFKIKEYPSVRKEAGYLYNNPEFRAKDVNDAFADQEVKAIFSSIGGEDSVRILPFLNKEIIKNNPKIVMGYSDTSTLTTYLNQLGLVTFNGPSVMAGFSQWDNLEEKFHNFILTFLFKEIKNSEYPTFDFYSNGYANWSDKNNTGKVKEELKNEGCHWLQGEVIITGQLYGGCIEVLEFMKGTDFWPEKDFWNNKILFLETSEDKPSLQQIKWMLRNYGTQGIFNKIKALIFGRARDYTDDEKIELDKIILQIVRGEFKNPELLVVTNMDFGHTDPQFILPLGIEAEINPINKTFKLIESPFI